MGIFEAIMAVVMVAATIGSTVAQGIASSDAKAAQQKVANKQESMASEEDMIKRRYDEKQRLAVECKVGSAIVTAVQTRENLQNKLKVKAIEAKSAELKGVQLAIRPYGNPVA